MTTTVVLLENIYRSRGAPAQAVLEQQLFGIMFDIVPCDFGVICLPEKKRKGSRRLCSARARGRDTGISG